MLIVSPVFAMWIIMKPPPPMPADCGSTTFERVGDRDRGVDRIAALLEDLRAGCRAVRIGDRDHALLERLAGP